MYDMNYNLFNFTIKQAPSKTIKNNEFLAKSFDAETSRRQKVSVPKHLRVKTYLHWNVLGPKNSGD